MFLLVAKPEVLQGKYWFPKSKSLVFTAKAPVFFSDKLVVM